MFVLKRSAECCGVYRGSSGDRACCILAFGSGGQDIATGFEYRLELEQVNGSTYKANTINITVI